MKDNDTNNKIIVVFDGIINMNRTAHIIKIINILSHIFSDVIIIVSRLTLQSLVILSKNLSQKIKLQILDTRNPVALLQEKRRLHLPLVDEWMLHIVQILRMRNALHDARKAIIMGTLNIPAMIILRLIGLKVYVFAGGFVYPSLKQFLGIKLRSTIRFVLIYIVECLATLLSNYLIIESKNIRKYVPPSYINKFLNNKIIDYGSLYLDTKVFNINTPIEQRKEVVGYIGALEPYRASLELIEAFKILAKINPNVKFVIIGSGSLQSKIIEILTLDHSLKQRTLYINSVPYSKIPEYLNVIKILVFPTRSEGLPNIVLEALACGCAVLASPIGGIPDVIKDYQTGFIIHGELTPQNIAEHILRLIHYPKLSEISRNGRKYVEEKYNTNKVIKLWKVILD
jgi:glycosyltransferase involved in cell wall biosynthesis